MCAVAAFDVAGPHVHGFGLGCAARSTIVQRPLLPLMTLT